MILNEGHIVMVFWQKNGMVLKTLFLKNF